MNRKINLNERITSNVFYEGTQCIAWKHYREKSCAIAFQICFPSLGIGIGFRCNWTNVLWNWYQFKEAQYSLCVGQSQFWKSTLCDGHALPFLPSMILCLCLKHARTQPTSSRWLSTFRKHLPLASPLEYRRISIQVSIVPSNKT